MTVSANQFVQINPGVLAAGGDSLVLNGLLLTNNAMVPIGTVQGFPNAPAVGNFFGLTSNEYAQAGAYFSGYANKTQTPGNLLFSQYSDTAVSAWVRSGSLAAMTLSQLQAFSGSLSVTIDGTVKTAASISLAGVTSFTAAAELIGFNLGIEGVSVASVTGSISTTTLTVTAVASGTISVGDVISGPGVTAGTYITAILTGTGGVGTYTVSASQTVASETITVNAPGVTYNAQLNAFVIWSGTTGTTSTINYPSGTLATDLLQVFILPFRRFGEAFGIRDVFTSLVAPLKLEGKRACLLEASLSQQPYGREDCNDVPKSGRPTSIAGHWGGGSREHALLLTTTKMEEGEPVVFAPFTFADSARIKTLNGDGMHPDNVSVIKAAVASARFPLVLPPYVVRKGKDFFNFVDGGYADNSGAGVAGRLLSHLKSVEIPAPKNADVKLKADIHIILITSDDGHRAAKPYFGSRIFADFLVPFETLLNVRARIGPSGVADLLDTISERVSTIGYGDSNIFLGWTISARTLVAIHRDVTGQTAGACPAKSNRAHPLCNNDRIRDIANRLSGWNNASQAPTAGGG